MGGKMPAAYHRTWRAKHRERVNVRQRVRRRLRYATDPAYRAAKLAAGHKAGWWRTGARPDRTPVPCPFLGHPAFDQARQVAGPIWYGARVYDPLREDATSEAVLALLEGRDPHAAVQRYLRTEWAWRWWTRPLYERR